jgi:hypothetical protein
MNVIVMTHLNINTVIIVIMVDAPELVISVQLYRTYRHNPFRSDVT